MAATNITTPSTTKSRDNLGPAQSTPTAGTSTARATMLNLNLLAQDVLNLLGFTLNRPLANPGLAISSNFDVKNGNAISVSIAGVLSTLSANTNFDTGTTANIASNKWGIGILLWDGTTATIVWAAPTAAQTFATEAAAKAALGTAPLTVPAGKIPIGYFTNLTASAQTWTAGTDALQGGTGGNPATTTNYYNDPTLNNTYGVTGALTASQVGNMSGTVITS